MNRTEHVSDEVLADLSMRLFEGPSTADGLQHISGCPSCEQRFRDMAAEWERSAVYAPEILESPARAARATSSPWRRLRQWLASPQLRWAAVALTAVALFLFMIPRLIETPSESQVTMLPALTPDVLPRAVLPNAGNDAMIQGLDAYARKDFDAAIAALASLQTTGPADALRRVYLASAYAWTAQHEQAVETLEDVPLDAVPDPWSAEARWMLYLSLTEMGQSERAQAVLRELAATPGEAGSRARAVIAKESTR